MWKDGKDEELRSDLLVVLADGRLAGIGRVLSLLREKVTGVLLVDLISTLRGKFNRPFASGCIAVLGDVHARMIAIYFSGLDVIMKNILELFPCKIWTTAVRAIVPDSTVDLEALVRIMTVEIPRSVSTALWVHYLCMACHLRHLVLPRPSQ